MKQPAAFIIRHRRLLLTALLTVTLLVSSEANRRAQEESVVTSLPVSVTAPGEAVAVYVTDRNAAHDRDIAALAAIVASDGIDASTRESAAQQIEALTLNRERQQALETALSSTSLAPCAAVVTEGSVTIITSKQDVTAEDSALVLTLASVHAGAKPSDVRILTVP